MSTLSLEHYILGAAVAFFVLCVAYSLRGKRPALPSLPSLGPKRPSILDAFESIESEGRTAAAKQLSDEIAAHYAAEFKAKLTAALGPKATAPPKDPSSSAGA
jgi:hypothetical protein